MMIEIKVLFWVRQGLIDLYALIGFLTRLPCPWPTQAGQMMPFPPFGRILAYAPVVGLMLSLSLSAVIYLLTLLALPVSVVAVIALITVTLLTGALHEDGFADCCDSFWGGQTREKRLAILSDSRLGSYGALGLFLSSLCRWLCLTELLEITSLPCLFWYLAFCVTLSRSFFLPMIFVLPPAKKTGLGHMSQTDIQQSCYVWLGCNIALVGIILTLLICLAPDLWRAGLVCFCLVLTVFVIWSLICQQKIGGQTGDCLGAFVILAELFGMIGILALIGRGYAL